MLLPIAGVHLRIKIKLALEYRTETGLGRYAQNFSGYFYQHYLGSNNIHTTLPMTDSSSNNISSNNSSSNNSNSNNCNSNHNMKI